MSLDQGGNRGGKTIAGIIDEQPSKRVWYRQSDQERERVLGPCTERQSTTRTLGRDSEESPSFRGRNRSKEGEEDMKARGQEEEDKKKKKKNNTSTASGYLRAFREDVEREESSGLRGLSRSLVQEQLCLVARWSGGYRPGKATTGPGQCQGLHRGGPPVERSSAQHSIGNAASPGCTHVYSSTTPLLIQVRLPVVDRQGTKLDSRRAPPFDSSLALSDSRQWDGRVCDVSTRAQPRHVHIQSRTIIRLDTATGCTDGIEKRYQAKVKSDRRDPDLPYPAVPCLVLACLFADGPWTIQS